MCQKVRNLIRELLGNVRENGPDLRITTYDIDCPFLMRSSNSPAFLDVFESMTEGAMTQIVQESRANGNPSLVIVVRGDLSPDHLQKLSCNVKDTNAVREPRMRCTGKHELGKTELAYSAKALELASVNKPPHKLIYLIFSAEEDEAVNRIENALGFGQ